MTTTGRSILIRLCAAAFLADMALYLVMTGAPYKALALGAGPLVLGFLPVARALPYSLTTVWAGSRTEGTERLRLTRGSLVVAAMAAAVMMAVPSIPWIYSLLGIVGLTLAFFWPAVQATLADVAQRGTVAGNLGWFNIAWSTGKATGFLVGGFLLAGLGFGALFATAALALVGVAVLVATLPQRTQGSTSSVSNPADADTARAPARTRRFRLAAWIGNSIAFGVGAVLNTHYPEWLEEIGHDEALFGSYLGFIFAAQTLTFAALTRFSGWRYRLSPLILSQVPLIIVLVVLPRLTHPALILATAPWVGLGLGMSYFDSIFYSLHAPVGRGRNAGVHEALLGVGTMILPVLGGWVANRSGHLEAPYLVAAGIGLVALVAQAVILGSGGRSRASEREAR
jgi:MFS family permease